MEPSHNTDRLFDFQKVENVIQGIFHKLNSQASEIQTLKQSLREMQITSVKSSEFKAAQSEVASVKGRLGKIESAVEVSSEIGPSVGAAVGRAWGALAALEAAAARKASAADLGARARRLEDLVERRRGEILAWAAERGEVERLGEGQRALARRLGALEAALACKVDKTETAQLEVLSSRLGNYADFMDTTHRQLEALAGGAAAAAAAAARQREALAALRARADALERTAADLASSADLAGLMAKVGAVQRAVAARAGLGPVQALARRAAEADEALAGTRAALAALTTDASARLGALEAAQGALCTVDHMESRAGRPARAAAAAAARLEAEAEGRRAAGERRWAGLAGAVDELRRGAAEHGRQLAVALKFVGWYAARGAAHEHNLRAVDGHLRRAARDALAGAAAGAGGGGGGGGGGGAGGRRDPFEEHRVAPS